MTDASNSTVDLAALEREIEQLDRELEETPEEKLARLQSEVAIKKAIRKAEVEHGRVGKKIAVVRYDGGVVILGRANPLKFKRFTDQLGDDNVKDSDAIEALVRPCVLHPPMTEFEQVIEQFPAVLGRCANEITVLAGMVRKELSGKS